MSVEKKEVVHIFIGISPKLDRSRKRVDFTGSADDQLLARICLTLVARAVGQYNLDPTRMDIELHLFPDSTITAPTCSSVKVIMKPND